MRIFKNKYWLDICNEDYYNPKTFFENEIDGFWICFLYENIENPNDKIVKITKDFVLNNTFKSARIGLPYFDRLVVFTSCNKNEINKVKKDILNNIKVKEKNMYWEANFEVDELWKINGSANQIDKTLSLYEKYLTKMNLDNINKKQLVTQKCKMYQKITEDMLERRAKMIIKPVFGNINYNIVPKSIFLIMPFGEKWSNDTFDVIQDIVDMTGTKLIRGDDLFEPAVIVDDIWRELNKAEIVIADITIHNANVFYEIGIAHTLGKKVILIRKNDGQDAPFDIKLWRYYDYDLSPIKVKKFKEQMVALINKILRNK